MNPTIPVCALCGKNAPLQDRTWEEPSPEYGDTYKRAYICEECSIVRWAYPAEAM